MAVPLSPETVRRLEALFAEPERSQAEALLVAECGDNLPLLGHLDARRLERFRFAALKLCAGDLQQLRAAVALAQVDWRDLLVAAGFARDVRAHEAWFPGEAD